MKSNWAAMLMVLAVLAVLLLGFFAVYANEVYLWWVYNSMGPSLDEAMGIHCGLIAVQFPAMEAPEEVFAVVSVQKGGIADQAGILPGDIPVNISPCVSYLPPRGALYAHLENSRGSVARLYVLNKSDVMPGWFRKVRRIDVPVPKQTGAT